MLNLNDREWSDFFIENKDIAVIESGRDIYEDERIPGKSPYASSTSANNGIAYFINNSNETLESGCISVNRNGSVGYAFYHPYPTLYSNDCRKIRLKHQSKYIGIFVAHQITEQRAKYNYGYKMGTGRLKRQKILLPITADGLPDWRFMEDYIREREEYLINKYIRQIGKIPRKRARLAPPNEKQWREFKVICYFQPRRGREANMASLQEGNIPLISAKNVNNGLKAFVIVPSDRVHPGHTITLNNDGDGGAGLAYYQPAEFALDSHVTSLRPKSKMSKYIMIFISAAISKQRESFGHGYSISDKRLKELKIMLPISDSDEPDWEYMEQYAKVMMNKQIRIYLDYIKHRV